ncbi:hypothetical protein [Halomarina oriensis]|uniref:Uncharacterized protein n=1 Tax=Halomarina oriensis TaxID=671145 RepID=A0A6B0GGI0_9EURY|nr:hypothetical protein [Halomarina oriensis]MWG33942.1 hypothetical protein [Halomarina oriensis]
MDFSSGSRVRTVVGVTLIVSLSGTAVVAQHSLLETAGRYVSAGDVGGLVFVAWLTLLLVVAVGNVPSPDVDDEDR